MEDKKFLCLSSFWLKVIALFTMTCDHVGFALSMYYYGAGPALDIIIPILRAIGRLAFPLFCFMICEGVIHTRNFKRYAMQLGIMMLAIMIAIIGTTYIPWFRNNGFDMSDEGNIFIDLLLGAVAVYLLKQDKKALRPLAILPIAFVLLEFGVKIYEWTYPNVDILWFPKFLRPQYDCFGVLLIVGFYCAYLIKDLCLKAHAKSTGINENTFVGTWVDRFLSNCLLSLVLIVWTVLFYVLLNYAIPGPSPYVDPSYAAIAIIFIFLYNGKRGYNKAWFKYGSYLYYPIHMLIIFGIFELISIL